MTREPTESVPASHHLYEITKLEAEVERLTERGMWLRTLLKEARQYVDDAGTDEDRETQQLSGELLAEIDAALEPKP